MSDRIDGRQPEHPAILVYRTDDGQILHSNQACHQLTGYSADELLGRQIERILQVESDQPSSTKAQLRHRDGSSNAVQLCRDTLDDSTGLVLLSIASDDRPRPSIVEQIIAQRTDELRDDNERLLNTIARLQNDCGMLEQAQRQAGIGWFEYFPETGSGNWSDETFHFFYRQRELGTPTFEEFLSMVHPDDVDPILEANRLLIESRQPVSIDMRTHPDLGPLRWLHATVQGIATTDHQVTVTGSFHDVTEQVLAEHELRRNERQLRFALRAARAATWEWDRLQDQFSWHAVSETELGTVSEYVHSVENYLQHTHPADQTSLRAEITRMIDDTEPNQTVRHEHRIRINDQWKWVELTGSPLGADAGCIWCGTLSDITDRRLQEESLRQKELKLAHNARLTTMGELVAGIAHELNQPLYSIVNFSRACANIIADRNDVNFDQLEDWIERITSLAEHGGEIIRRMRQFSGRRFGQPRDWVCPRKLADDALLMLDFEARRQHQAQVEIHCPENIPKVIVDEVLVEQVMVNLLRNALEAMEHQPENERRIDIRFREADDWVQVEIADQGPGFPDDMISSLIDPFVTTRSSGMGMGLAISNSIIESHGGEFNLRNSHPRGAVLSFTLPTREYK